MTTWFTSDHHFFHNSIIHHAKRPFSSTEEMNEVMIERWNSRVKRGDLVRHMGDFSLGRKEETEKVLRRLNGSLLLVKGNHDKTAIQLKHMFEAVKDLHEVRIDSQKIVLCHYAMRIWNASFHDSWHLYGHSHGFLSHDMLSLSMDVGVDCTDFYPISFDEVREIMEKKKSYKDEFCKQRSV